MHHRSLFSGDGPAGPTGAALCTALQPTYRPDQHYPFWILPTKESNDLMCALACRFIKPFNHIFSLTPRIEDYGGKARAVVYYYTLYAAPPPKLTSERNYTFDKWIWEGTWTVRKREGARQVTYRRTGLDLRTTLQSAGAVWLGDAQMDWVHSHLGLPLLQRVYIPRSPGHAAWSTQAATQNFSRATVASAYIVQSLLGEAQRCRTMEQGTRALQLERRAARVAAQEIARSSQLHLLERLEQVWRSSVIETHSSPQDLRKAFPNGPNRLVELVQAF